MKVALVHDWLTGMRGGEKVLAEVASFFPTAPIFTLLYRKGSISGELARHPIQVSWLQRWTLGGRFYRPLLPLMPRAVEELNLSGFDLVISSSHCVAKGVIPSPGAVHICYCHTPMRYAWDQRDAYLRRVPWILRGWVKRRLAYLRLWDVVSSARVDHFVANSQLVARRIRHYFRRDAEVIPPPVDTEFFTPGNGKGKHLLMVAALVPYKRVEVGIAVAKALRRELRIVGEGHLRRHLARSCPEQVTFLGRVSDERLRDEYRQAALLLVPNVEDFGMATVEALACGTPVVGLEGSGTADIVVDGEHGLLVEDPSVEALAQACQQALERHFSPAACRERAESFSRSRFRRRFRYLLERVGVPL
ncbi:MAG: glycosyltransferase [Thermoanaerobaculum sp.]|nr:glycosyltransferase [Thermoanaerobaculum sp.]